MRQEGVSQPLNVVTSIIGASLSEPLLDELAGAFLWYIYIYIFVSMGSPFGPAWAPVNAQRANVRPAE